MFDYDDIYDFSVSSNTNGGGISKKKSLNNNRMKKQSTKKTSDNSLYSSKHVRISQAKSEKGQQKQQHNSNYNKTCKSKETRKSNKNK